MRFLGTLSGRRAVLGILLCAVLGSFGLHRESGGTNENGSDRSVFKQADVHALATRLEQGNVVLRKAPELAQNQLFCPGGDNFADGGRGRFVGTLASDAKNRTDYGVDAVRGRGPPPGDPPA